MVIQRNLVARLQSRYLHSFFATARPPKVGRASATSAEELLEDNLVVLPELRDAHAVEKGIDATVGQRQGDEAEVQQAVGVQGGADLAQEETGATRYSSHHHRSRGRQGDDGGAPLVARGAGFGQPSHDDKDVDVKDDDGGEWNDGLQGEVEPRQLVVRDLKRDPDAPLLVFVELRAENDRQVHGAAEDPNGQDGFDGVVRFHAAVHHRLHHSQPTLDRQSDGGVERDVQHVEENQRWPDGAAVDLPGNCTLGRRGQVEEATEEEEDGGEDVGEREIEDEDVVGMFEVGTSGDEHVEDKGVA